MVVIKNANGSEEKSIGGPYYSHGPVVTLKKAKKKWKRPLDCKWTNR